MNDINGFDMPVCQEDITTDYLTALNKTNFQIAELCRIKEELEKRVSALFEHSDDLSRTYLAGKYKVTITTGYNYSLNKDEYEILSSLVPECFNPVNKRIAYDLNKKVLKQVSMYGDEKTKALVFGKLVDGNIDGGFIKSSPKKINVKIVAGV
jgi:hypothetical protein